ncbi:hypothetical protein PHYSODRAFT_295443 [Phytophthora sojae]|uniref:Uncharacterized protein n=1 Tax=Phytophthora sojae (strain P6497) TaxID=1094619 RepID=G4Z0U1_PHYSP|nr:hypothetical protein PHYSODRAFT_295443 [Phytophthora sojae]EGZ22780.1 hypothetical protein PHYSODRAFT_295443 [Phytophthora sojae]|eukprot:XP_009518068.1 hypothetical protein PHYSODRAFT_295443 [Phytophthora sojae]
MVGAKPSDPGQDAVAAAQGAGVPPSVPPQAEAGNAQEQHHRPSQDQVRPAPSAPPHSAPSGRPAPGSPWTGNSASVLSASRPISEEQERSSRIVTGVWNPLLKKRLITTMLHEWVAPDGKMWTDEERRLRDVALAPGDVNRGQNIREMTAEESQALLPYVRGELELPHPHNFVKSTISPLHRAMLDDIHEAHQVNLEHNATMPHVELFRELYNYWPRDDAPPVARCEAVCLRWGSYFGLCFPLSPCGSCVGVPIIRIQRTVITLHDTVRRSEADAGSFTAVQLDGVYALHVRRGSTAFVGPSSSLYGAQWCESSGCAVSSVHQSGHLP